MKLGERSFEIALARRMKTGELTTEWFERHDDVDTAVANRSTAAAEVDSTKSQAAQAAW